MTDILSDSDASKELQSIKEMMLNIYTPEDADLALDLPQNLLWGKTPRELVYAGEAEKVKDIIQAIIDGAYL